MSVRLLPDWIASYLKFTENTEPPRSYHTWTAISILAGALQRRVYMRWGHEVIYPNLYVILVGPSGRSRKGTAMKMGKGILQEIKGVTLTSESITREALIRAMKSAVTNFADGPDIRFQCAITCISPELSVFLGQKDIKFLSNLTDWYDSSDQWTYETKGAGIDSVQGVCFNLLGATAPDWIQSMLPQEAIGGGFTSRCIFVVEEDKGQVVAKELLTEEDKKIRITLKNDLEIISTVTGEVKFDEEAERAYIKWYENQEKLIALNKMPVDDPRFSGYCERRATHVKKICMIVSVAHGNSLIVTRANFITAVDFLEKVELKMSKAFGGLGRARFSDITQIVLEYMEKHKEVRRSDLMRMFYREMDSLTLKIVEEVLEQMKVIKISRDIQGNEVTYVYIKRD